MNTTTGQTNLSARIVTHKLNVKLPSDEWRVIYLTTQEAYSIMEVINDREVLNINIADARIVDNPPESYPKRWCHIQPITDEDRKRWAHTARQRQEDQARKEAAEAEEAKIDQFIQERPDIWDECLEEAQVWIEKTVGRDAIVADEATPLPTKKSVDLLRTGHARGLIKKRMYEPTMPPE